MTRARTLQLLLAAEIPTDVPSIEATMHEISTRLDAAPDADTYVRARARHDQLLDARQRILDQA